MEDKKDLVEKNKSVLERSIESSFSKDLVRKKEQDKKVSFNNDVKPKMKGSSSISRFKSSKPTEYMGREEKIDPDIFYHYKDENERLKMHQNKLNDQVKQLTTKIERVKYDMIVERKMADRRVIVKGDNDFNVEIETVKMENEKLKEKLEKFKTIIQGMQTQQKVKTVNPKKSLMKAQNTLDNQNERNELLKMINKLRNKLIESENEILRLNTELYGPNKTGKIVGEYSKEIKDKMIQLSELQVKFEKLQQHFDTNVKILEHTKENLDEYISKLNNEKKKNMELEHEVQLLNANLANLPDYVKLIDELKIEKKILEERINDLVESPYIKDAEERGNVFRKYKESEIALNEATKKIRILEDNLRNIDKEFKGYKEKYDTASQERDKLKEEALRYKVAVEEREKNSKNFEEQLKMLGQFGEVDSNFTKILNILKLKDDNTPWMNIDFIQKMQDNNDKDPASLLKEIDRQKLEKGILGSELEKTKALLQIQQQINEDSRLKYEEDIKILKYQLEYTKNKCEELAALVDLEKVPRDKMTELRKDLFDSRGLQIQNHYDNIQDNITEFSKDERESDFGMNENSLDIYLGEVLFEEGLSRELGFKLNNLMSFLAVDFFMHETQTSNIISGIRPQYNLQLSFRVNVDEHFMKYMETEYIYIEILYIKNNVQALLAKAKIPLIQILQAEDPNLTNMQSGTKTNGFNNQKVMSRVINNVCQIFYVKDEKMVVGNLHYKMRMRQQLTEIIKWYREKEQMIKELSPVEEVLAKKVEKEFALHQIGTTQGKTMQITILISKGMNLKLSGPPRAINPYVFYQFFKFDEHYTVTGNTADPLFDDVERYDVVYDTQFHEYIENSSLEFYVLDNSRSLEVKFDKNSKNEICLIDQPEQEDLIGIGKIGLKDLLIHDVIQGAIPLFNRKGVLSGEIYINIFWETLKYDLTTEKMIQNTYETKAWTEKAVGMLAEKMKAKKLDLNSAFEIFDRDEDQMISLNDFNDTVLFTLNFTQNQQLLEELKRAVFNNKTTITKLEFYKIFAYYLPHEGPVENLIKREIEETKIKVIKVDNQVVGNTNLDILSSNDFFKKLDDKRDVGVGSESLANFDKTIELPKEQEKKMTPPEKKDLSKTINLTNNINPINISTNNIDNQTSVNFKNTRKLSEIVVRIQEYMKQKNKRTIVEFFKLLDKDGNSFIDRDELTNGFNRIGIIINEDESRLMWRDLTQNNSNQTKVDLSLFRSFIERNK